MGVEWSGQKHRDRPSIDMYIYLCADDRKRVHGRCKSSKRRGAEQHLPQTVGMPCGTRVEMVVVGGGVAFT